MGKLKYQLIYGLLFYVVWSIFHAVPAHAQARRDSVRISPRDALRNQVDTTGQAAQTDTTGKKREIDTTIKYTARDSIVLDVNGKIARLYGDAKIDYGQISLNAAYVEINWQTSIIDARGVPDSTGKLEGKPVFKDGGQTYTTEGMSYNIKTRKAIISGVVTQQGEGYVHGTRVFKDEEDNLYIRNALYTTCNLEHPHFHIAANKIKVVKDKQIVTGPFNLVINDIPTPLGFAFGMFPYSQTRKSGIIVPTYGEEPRERGYFLRNGGYYWAVNDNISLSFLGEIYSRGGWGLNMRSQYVKKYAYNGNFDVRFNRRRAGDEGFKTTADDFWVTWSHVPFSKGTGRFAASVNAGTSKFNLRNAYNYGSQYEDVSRRISNTFSSNVSYSNAVRGLPITYGFNARHDMNATTGVMNLTLPDVNMSVNRIYPFKGKTGGGKGFWKTINLAYNFNASNRLTNAAQVTQNTFQGLRIANASPVAGDTVAFNFANLDELLRRAQIGAQHSIPASMSMKLFKYFSANYSFSYNETWYPQKLNFTGVPKDSTSITIDTLRGFARSYSYNASAGITTNIYGTFYVNRGRWVAVRHRMVPNVSLSYAPDFSRNTFGFYDYVDLYGPSGEVVRTEPISRFQNTLYGIPGRGSSGSIGFNLSNTVEAKLRAKEDTSTDKKEKFEKVSLLDQANISTSYNMAAKEFKLQPFNINARTRLFQKIDINFTSTLDPYATVEYYDKDGRIQQLRTGTVYAWSPRPQWDRLLNPATDDPEDTYVPAGVPRQLFDHGGIIRWSKRGLGQLTTAVLSFSTNLNPQANKNKNKTPATNTEDGNPDVATEDERALIAQVQANRDAYVDFTIPWSLNVSYNLSYTRQGFQPARIVQALTFSGDLKVTDKWKVGFTSGYDFVQKKIVDISSLSIYRDLHCWSMNINWTPFGRFQSYSFDLKVNASILQDLKLSRRRTWYDRGVDF
ncbi:MAG: LPS-assembly protein LptD [Cytophagales bacterium]|nr:LPS-assembly protein LptD [Cytophagales bacterium]